MNKCDEINLDEIIYILAVPDPALLGFDYFPIYYLLIIVIPDFALLTRHYSVFDFSLFTNYSCN